MKQHLGSIAIVVRDYDEAIDYYTKVLGFTLVEDTSLEPTEPGKRWVLVAPPGSNETRLLLAKAAKPAQEIAIGNQSGGRVFLFLHTDNFWRDYYTYTERGIKWVRPPSEHGYGIVAVFADLYGNLWDLVEMKSEK